MERTLEQAVALYHAEKLEEAARLCLSILETQPGHAGANHMMGVIAVQLQQHDAALSYLMAALDADSTCGQYWLSYIDALFQAGQLQEAREVLALARQQGLSGEPVEALAVRLGGGAQPATPDSASSPQEVNALAALFNTGRLSEAAALAQELTVRFPKHGFGWKVLGAVLKQMGHSAEALEPMQKAVALSPDDADAHNNLGAIFHDLNHPSEAEASYRRALQLNPNLAEAYSNLGSTLLGLGRPAEAETACRQALRLKSDNASTCYSLGLALQKQGLLEKAEASYRHALQLKPDYVDAYINLGSALQSMGQLDKAAACHRKALEIKPDSAEAHNNLGTVFQDMNRLADAEASYRRALKIRPNYAEAHYNLGITLKNMNRLNEAEASYQRALQIAPNFSAAHSNLLFLLNYLPESDQASNLAEARRFGQMVTEKATSRFTEWVCDKHPERLRIGFVSGDLKNHPVGHFLENLLKQLDPASLELFAYPTVHACDKLTERIKPCFSAWKPLTSLNDEAAAHLIHNDGIHVLVDLSGHTCENRLPLFAWKPAPVQVSWLGYFATTGVAEIDYLIADPWTLPESEEAFFTEKIWRLPETRLCFTPPNVEVAVSPLPALANGYVTFGCFNNLAKMNDAVVALWASVLAAVPGSRLFLKARQLDEASVRQGIVERFAAQGIEMQRLILEGPEPRAKYLAAYHRVDIALDPFPFTGATTSVEGLWMGVPLLTLAGKSFLSRQGIGILMNAGLPEWIAESPDDYVARAVSHAGNMQQLSTLRGNLRQQVLDSPIFDGTRFARHFEQAMRSMWHTWRNKQAE